MATPDFTEFGFRSGVGPTRGARFSRLVNGAGAATSALLIAGLCLWGYQLAVRDVAGVPVIRALGGPARVAPDDPGGDLAQHRGMAVNTIASEGEAAPPADTLMLAPRQPDLGDDYAPMDTLAPEVLAAAGVDPGAAATPAPDMVAYSQPEVTLPPSATAIAQAEPLPDGPVDPILDPDEAGEPLQLIAADVPGVARSPRPQARPGSGTTVAAASPATADAEADADAMAEAALAAVSEALAPPPPLDVDAASLAPGTRLVQLGAFADESEAKLEWERATLRFGALMEGKSRVIEAAESGGQTFFRLRVAGFADLADARRFCAALQAENALCVPAQVR